MGVAATGRVRSLLQTLREIFFGMTGYEFSRHAMQMRSEMETVFLVVTMGDLIGIPVLPPYYSLRLVPFVVPSVATWKRRVLRPHELWEKEEYDLIEM